jgi:Domain of unknown function (DUF4382)
MRSTRYWRLGALAAAASAAAACSGSSGDGGSGTLTLSLMDAAVDHVTEVHVEITAIWLKPAGGPAVELPLTDTPITVDLLELTVDNAAILVDGALVDAGTYEWLAMDVNAEFDNVFDSYVLTDTGGMEEIRVPSGRVRLVSGFEVAEAQAVQFLFDWDLRQALVDPPAFDPGFILKPAFRVIDVTEYGVLRGAIAVATVTDAANDCNADDPVQLDYDIGNVVYIYTGLGVTPDDIDANDPEPLTTVDAVLNAESTHYEYRMLLAPGEYTIAFTCHGGNDTDADELGHMDPLDDTVAFFAPAAAVTMTTDAELTVDFPVASP